MRPIHKSLLVTTLCALMLVGSGPGRAYGSPHAAGDIPDGVGRYSREADPCTPGSVIFELFGGAVSGVLGSGSAIAGTLGGHVAEEIAGSAIADYLEQGCSQAIAEVYAKVAVGYSDAYLRAEQFPASPGYPDGGVHDWVGFRVQDFSGGTDSSGNLRGDGWGAIVWGGGDVDESPHFIGGGHWVAYKHAVYELDIVPGYPITSEHQKDLVTLQEFQGGSWGDAAIIGGDNAWLVAGRHWDAYATVAGWSFLGNPLGPMYQNGEGWYQQDFDLGMILELDHDIRVVYHDGSAVELSIP